MMKLAYALGARQACEQLGLKVAALPAVGVSQSSGRTSATPSKAPFWGLGGPTPQGFSSNDPASTQAGAQPGGPSQLDAAPLATPPRMGTPPPPNPGINLPGATGITAPLEAKAMPGAGGGAAPKSTAARSGTDVSGAAASTSGAPTR